MSRSALRRPVWRGASARSTSTTCPSRRASPPPWRCDGSGTRSRGTATAPRSPRSSRARRRSGSSSRATSSSRSTASLCRADGAPPPHPPAQPGETRPPGRAQLEGLRTVELRTKDEGGQPVIGVIIDQSANIKLPFPVKIQAGSIIGPSAGLGFALEIWRSFAATSTGIQGRSNRRLQLDGSCCRSSGVETETIEAKRIACSTSCSFLLGRDAAEAARFAGGHARIPVERLSTRRCAEFGNSASEIRDFKVFLACVGDSRKPSEFPVRRLMKLEPSFLMVTPSVNQRHTGGKTSEGLRKRGGSRATTVIFGSGAVRAHARRPVPDVPRAIAAGPRSTTAPGRAYCPGNSAGSPSARRRPEPAGTARLAQSRPTPDAPPAAQRGARTSLIVIAAWRS